MVIIYTTHLNVNTIECSKKTSNKDVTLDENHVRTLKKLQEYMFILYTADSQIAQKFV